VCICTCSPVASKYARCERARVSSSAEPGKDPGTASSDQGREMPRGEATTNPAPPRVLVVDDSAFMRRMTSQIIDASGEFTVVGTARNGHDALKQVHELDPDIVTLDVDMPGLDGLGTLGYIMSETPRACVMLSAGTTRSGHEATLRALELGAVDFVMKPSGSISLDIAIVGDRLLDALRAASAANLAGLRMLPRLKVDHASVPIDTSARATSAVVIASSTGGPRALAALVPTLPRALPAAVLFVQHMPTGFTKSLAQRLDTMSPLGIAEAEDGQPLVHGRGYVAPGGRHMIVRQTEDGPCIALDDSPPLWGVRPAADILFRSAAAVFGRSTVAAVLTGMGRDGAEGTRLIREAGGRAVLQDRETATIFGMPQVALQHAGADRVAPLGEIGASIAQFLDEIRHAQ
jgi:two-component system chemotaxis response regulator CheB